MAAITALQSSFTSFSLSSNSFLGQRVSSPSLEWAYFLNKGSKVNISYSVKSPSSAPLSLVIAQGRESLVEWIEDPSYPNTTLSWNIIHGNGIIQQEILWSKFHYIAVGNLNSEEVENYGVLRMDACSICCSKFSWTVQLNFTIKGFLYNTTQAYYKCSLSHRLCSLKLFLLRANAAVLTSPATEQTRNATGLVAPAIVASLGALTHTLGTLVPMIGASGFATIAAVAAVATTIGTVVDSFR